MTEFDKFWERNQELDKEAARKVWRIAQVVLIRTIANPPVIPEKGDKIRFLSLCHKSSLEKVKKVESVTKDTLDIYWIETSDGETYSSGILAEVEKVND